MNAKQTLAHGLCHPYDDREPLDAAHQAALGALAELTGRSGIGDELGQLDADLRVEIVDAIAEIIREAMPKVAQSEPAPALDSIAVCVKVLDWNRTHEQPPIAIASEYSVANKVLEMAGLCPHGAVPRPPKSPDGNFNTGDVDLDLLLGLTEDITSGNANMDTGIWWMDVLERVQAKLQVVPAQEVTGE